MINIQANVYYTIHILIHLCPALTFWEVDAETRRELRLPLPVLGRQHLHALPLLGLPLAPPPAETGLGAVCGGYTSLVRRYTYAEGHNSDPPREVLPAAHDIALGQLQPILFTCSIITYIRMDIYLLLLVMVYPCILSLPRRRVLLCRQSFAFILYMYTYIHTQHYSTY